MDIIYSFSGLVDAVLARRVARLPLIDRDAVVVADVERGV
jgi:hypothetical protein